MFTLHQEVKGCSVLLPRPLVTLHMTTEIVRLNKPFPAYRADPLLLLCVFLSHVFLQVGVLSEPQSAPAANVRLHSLVEQLVAGQVVLVLKLLMTSLNEIN